MTAEDLQLFIQNHQHWAYGLLLAYALAKTGPLPMVAGFVSVSGALDTLAVLVVCGMCTLIGANLRFAVGRFFNTRLFRWAGCQQGLPFVSATRR